MTFRRTEDEWLRMTPAQLSALSGVHRRVTNPGKGGRGSTAPQQGGLADLLAFRNMRTA